MLLLNKELAFSFFPFFKLLNLDPITLNNPKDYCYKRDNQKNMYNTPGTIGKEPDCPGD
jgi:predicted ATPase